MNQDNLTDPKKWVDLYGDHLYRYAFARVRNRIAAEDLVQETFLAAPSHLLDRKEFWEENSRGRR